MSTELVFLTLTALLAASLWIPYIVGVNSTSVPALAENRPHDPGMMVPWVHRAYRAHLNLLEQFLPFAVLVLIGNQTGTSSAFLGTLAGAFFGVRLLHAVWMIAGLPVLPARPLIFVAGWFIILGYAGVILIG